MKKIRIPYLDGLRGISIIMVLLGHVNYALPKNEITKWIFLIIGNSHLGVMIFFVISGFLITNLLIEEKEENLTVNLKKFYLKRSIRIFPVFYSYIILIVILNTFSFLQNDFRDISIAASYLWNYKVIISPEAGNHHSWFLGHFWTLALEEQFYLLWPLLVFFLPIRKLNKLLIILLCLYPISRIVTYFTFPEIRGQIGMMLHTMGDAIFWGCLASILNKRNKESLEKTIIDYSSNNFLRILFVTFLILFLFVLSPVLNNIYKGSYSITVGLSVEGFTIASLLLILFNYPGNLFNFLNNKFITYIGVLSYSLYIWQQLFLTPLNTSILGIFPLNLLCCFIMALISYYFVEKPILNLKKKI